MNLFILVDYSQIEILVENFVGDIFFAPGGIIVLEPHQTSFKHWRKSRQWLSIKISFWNRLNITMIDSILDIIQDFASIKYLKQRCTVDESPENRGL